ncbi:MAG: hypothetical protein D6820_11715 [Lentisphaerae bacterium]|nr:MAG: hypothetical protein D6820_11715 [Lentisphaerota bacterium]
MKEGPSNAQRMIMLMEKDVFYPFVSMKRFFCPVPYWISYSFNSHPDKAHRKKDFVNVYSIKTQD